MLNRFRVVGVFAGLAMATALVAQAGPPVDAERYRNELVRNARAYWGVNAPIATLAGQVHQESSWRTDARSPYAAGLAQFTPGTAKWIAGAYPADLAGFDALNPAQALRALVIYDLHLYMRVVGAASVCDRMLFALSSYNGGEGWVRKRQALSPQPGNYRVTGHINPGIRPANQRENEDYGPRIVQRWQPLYTVWGPGVACT